MQMVVLQMEHLYMEHMKRLKSGVKRMIWVDKYLDHKPIDLQYI